MKGKQQQDFRVEKYIRYGIRKYSFGAASVAIAAGLMFLGNGAVLASETAVNGNISDVAVVSPNAEENGETAKVETAKEVKVEEAKPEVVTPKVEESKKEEVQKTYWALVDAAPPAEEGTLTHWLVRNEKQNKSVAHQKEVQHSKKAVLHYKLLKTYDRYYLLEIDLITGRHHQIRAQLAAIGLHIKGDLKYGAKRSNPDGGICLHAHSLRFLHPVKKENVSIEVAPNWQIG